MLLNLRTCLAHHSEHWQDCMYTEACWFWGTGIISRLAGLLCLPLTILFLTTHTFTCLPLNLIPAILQSNSLVIYMFSLPFLALCVWQSVDLLLILTPHQQHFLNLLNVCIIWWETTWRQNVLLVKAGLYSDHIKNEQVQNEPYICFFPLSPSQRVPLRTHTTARYLQPGERSWLRSNKGSWPTLSTTYGRRAKTSLLLDTSTRASGKAVKNTVMVRGTPVQFTFLVAVWFQLGLLIKADVFHFQLQNFILKSWRFVGRGEVSQLYRLNSRRNSRWAVNCLTVSCLNIAMLPFD